MQRPGDLVWRLHSDPACDHTHTLVYTQMLWGCLSGMQPPATQNQRKGCVYGGT